MAATSIRELLISIGVDEKAADAGLAKFDELQSKFDDVKGAAGALIGTLASIGAAVAAAAAGIAAVSIGAAAATAESAKEIERQAAAMGLSVEAYQELAFATAKYGVEATDLADALKQVALKTAEAAAGSETLDVLLASIGVSSAAFAAASPEQGLLLLADAMASTADEGARLAAADQILGGAGLKMLPLLMKGTAGIEELRREAHRLGIVMDEEAIRSGVAFSAQMSELGTIATALRQEFAISLMPTLIDLGERFLDWYKINKDVIDQKIDEYAGRIGDAFTAAGDALAEADRIVGGIGGWEALAGIVAVLTGAAGVALVAFQAVVLIAALVSLAASFAGAVSAAALFVGGGWVLAAIVAAVAAQFALLAMIAAEVTAVFVAAGLVIEDLWTYLQGGDSVLGRFIDGFRDAEGALGGFARFVEKGIGLLRTLWEVVSVLGQIFMVSLAPAIDFVAAALAAAWAPFGQLIDGFIRFLGLGVGTFFDDIVVGIDAMTAGLEYALSLLQKVLGIQTAGAPAASAAASAAGTAVGSFGTAPASGGMGAPAASAGLAPTGSGARFGAGGGATTQTVGGDTNNFYGTGMSKEEVESLMASRDEQKRRQATAVFAGREV